MAPSKILPPLCSSCPAKTDPPATRILKRVAGKDASKQFWKYHNEGILKKYQPKLQIGEVKEEAKL